MSAHLPRRQSVAAAATARRHRSARRRLGRCPERTRAQGSSRARRTDTRRHGNVCGKRFALRK